MSESLDYGSDSRASTPDSYITGEGGSLPPSPRLRERVSFADLRRAQSADASLNRRRLIVADMKSSTSGAVNTTESEEAQGELGPHAPFGTLTVEEAWNIMSTRKRLWYPIPIAWRDLPEMSGAAIFFNKYPNVYDESVIPDVSRIHAIEPSTADQDLNAFRKSVRKIGPQLLETIRRTTVPHDVDHMDSTTQVLVAEVPPVNPFPSHLLIIEQDPPIRGHRHRSFVPVHDIILLAFMTRINLPPRCDANPVQKGDKIEITLPVARLALPNPQTFERIVSYIYSAMRPSDLMGFFDRHMGYAGLPENARIEAAANIPRLMRLPFLNPADKESWITWSKQAEGRLAAQLSMTYCYERLINLMKDANLQFENVKVLMMYDNLFEAGLLLCRRVLLSAMTLSVVRDHLV